MSAAASRIKNLDRLTLAKRQLERGSYGLFACHTVGSNVTPTHLGSLDDFADFGRGHAVGVRMNPGWNRISKNTYIGGVRLR
jgi:hypothetical protein